MPLAKPGPANAHDAGVLGCRLAKPGPADAHDAGVVGVPLAKPGPAGAHDAGVLGCHWLSQVQLMLMMLGFWGAIG